MKQLLLKKENWLLIVPLLIWLLEETVTGLLTFDFHLHDTYFVINNASAGFIFLIASLIPVFCHLLLSWQNKGSNRILFWHVFISCLCYVVLYVLIYYSQFLSYEGLAGMPRRYYDFESWTEYIPILSNTIKAGIIVLVVFVLLQFLFLVYTVFKLAQKSKVSQPAG